MGLYLRVIKSMIAEMLVRVLGVFFKVNSGRVLADSAVVGMLLILIEAFVEASVGVVLATAMVAETGADIVTVAVV